MAELRRLEVWCRNDVEMVLVAVVLAGTSTVLGFGLLAFSSQPPLFHIGLTSAVGVLLCLALAPTVCALAAPSRRTAAPLS